MKPINSRSLVTALLAALGICPGIYAASTYSDGELLVKWKDGPWSYGATVGNAAIGSAVKRNFDAIGWQQVKLPQGMSVRDGIEAYQALGTVLAVEPNGTTVIEPAPIGREVPGVPNQDVEGSSGDGTAATPRHSIGRHGPTPSSAIPNDPMFNQQWYLRKIGATNAWAITTGSTNVVVAVLDSGVNYNHEDLAA